MTAKCRPRRDDGSVLVLLLGLVVLSALLITVVIDVSALFVARRDLLAAVDGAALAGAQAVDEAAVYEGGVRGTLPLEPSRVQAAVQDYVQSAQLASSVDGLKVEVHTDGTTVQVLMSGVVQLPVVNSVTPGAGGGVVVRASATARSAVLR